MIHSYTADHDHTFDLAVKQMGGMLLHRGKDVDTGHWQAMKNVPMTKTRELTNVILTYEVSQIQRHLEEDIKPSVPWAELQHQERVGGEPLNPGETYKLWPWYRGNVEGHKEQGIFSHTYMERFWPKWAPETSDLLLPQRGIRYDLGDFHDLCDLLEREPYTRQAYLPIWFPEDTGAHHGERVPCSLGYHFMLRDDRLHCTYTIRSCDFLRHFRDDVYLAARLMQEVVEIVGRPPQEDEGFASEAEELRYMTWQNVIPGDLTMHMYSLHVFEGDLPKMEREYGV